MLHLTETKAGFQKTFILQALLSRKKPPSFDDDQVFSSPKSKQDRAQSLA